MTTKTLAPNEQVCTTNIKTCNIETYVIISVQITVHHPQKYQGSYTPQRATGHTITGLFVIAQQPEYCPHSKRFLFQHVFLAPELDCMCEDKS